MNPLRPEADVEISARSGMLRVTVHPKTHWLLMLVQVAVIAFFSLYLYRGWTGISLLFRGLLLWAVACAVTAWFYQLSGSELIEIDSQKMTIRKNILGWERTSEYPLEDCSELEWREPREDDYYGLQCKVGWKTVRFGEYVSEARAIEILTVLQRQLPEIADKMLKGPDSSKKHFTTLGLS